MDQYGDKIRALKGSSLFDEQTSNDMASYRARCSRRNLRGECANPNLMGEYGNMSWDEYDRIKARGEDPRRVSEERSWRDQMERQSRWSLDLRSGGGGLGVVR